MGGRESASCYRLSDAEKANYSVSLLCEVLRVSRSGYYDWKDRPPSKRDRENATLAQGQAIVAPGRPGLEGGVGSEVHDECRGYP